MRFPALTTPILLLLLPSALAQANTTLPIRAVSFNIRYAATSLAEGERPWSERRGPLISQLAQLDRGGPANGLTILGLQEVLDGQLGDIKEGLGASWAHVGVARDDGAARGEYCPIVYRADVLRLLYRETKWLSPTPDRPSYGWGAGSRRVVTIAVFEELGSWARFIVANTHLDNASAQARTEGAKVVLERIRAVQEMWGPMGVVLTGDFNSGPGRDGHKVLADSGYLEEAFAVADAVGKVVGTNRNTFTGFTGSGGSFIDFVWFGPEGTKTFFSVERYEILTNVVSGLYISDHRAVVADLALT
ncbi:hypothetical protein MFIFM68171_06644 [Madurella fahalii]|uniref:Endonuclease/exonuclease/phosphatase domain-containing protein n=1 Tax=Madurella fahalii TaxID=1157608 RepID=A0ABQ0GF93_9PEZI